MPKFYKTTIVFEVLSTEPTTDMGLDDLLEACDSGPMVGDVRSEAMVEVSREEMADLLVEFRSDPSFFDLDDEEDD